MTYHPLPESVHTLYAELLEQLIAAEASESVGEPGGSFVSKTIKGRKYWYLQRAEAGKKRQIYLGPETPHLLDWMQQAKQKRETRLTEAEQRERLCDMLQAGGAFSEPSTVIKILALLANRGVFRLGGVIVGTHAFAAYGNMLGVRFDKTALRIQDLDIAHVPGIAVALSQEREVVDVPSTLKEADLNFHELPALNPKHPSTSFKIRGKQMRVDFLTPMVGRDRDRPVFVNELKTAARPLRFLDYLIEDPEQAAVVGGAGVLVNVPQPARFAFHKLLVSERRPVAFEAKAGKDIRQATQLIEVLLEHRKGNLLRAWEALKASPQAMRLVRAGLKQLPSALQDALSGMGINQRVRF